MNWKKVTGLFIAAVVLIAGIYDAWVWTTAGTEATISWVIFEASMAYPMVPFLVGILCGHFFWQMKAKAKLNDKTNSKISKS